MATIAPVPGQARAQGSGKGPGNPSILEAVEDLQSSLNAIQSSLPDLTSLSTTLTAIQNELTGIQAQLESLSAPGQENVRFTPFVNVVSSADVAYCSLLNVSNTAQTVRAQLINLSGGANEDTNEVVLGAGQGVSTNVSACLTCYCKFTVVGGSRTAIRGAVQVVRPGQDEKLAVPAE
jgi:hypothetical protein